MFKIKLYLQIKHHHGLGSENCHLLIIISRLQAKFKDFNKFVLQFNKCDY